MEQERFASFQPEPASTEFGNFMQEVNISGRNADRVIRRQGEGATRDIASGQEVAELRLHVELV